MSFPATRRKKRASHVCDGQRWAAPSLASERYRKSECQLEGSARCGRVVATRGRVICSWACVPGRLLEVKGRVERGKCICGQFRTSVDFLKKCAGELPIPVSDQDPTRILHDTLWSRRLRGVGFVSV